MSPHHSPIRGGPSDAFERRHVATGGQAGFVDRVRSSAAHVLGGLERRPELSARHHRTPRRRSRKRTYAYVVRSMRTLRFLLITRAGRLTRIGGRHVLRLAQNPATEALYTRIQHALAA
jgi:hypothetical protein